MHRELTRHALRVCVLVAGCAVTSACDVAGATPVVVIATLRLGDSASVAHASVPSDTLRMKRFVTDSIGLRFITSMVGLQGQVLLSDQLTSPHLIWVSTSGGGVTRRTGVHGDGRSQFILPLVSDGHAPDGALAYVDQKRKRYGLVKPGAMGPIAEQAFGFAFRTTPTRVFRASSGYIAAGTFADELFFAVDTVRGSVSGVRVPLLVDSARIPAYMMRARVNEREFAIAPDRRRIVVVYKHTPMLDLFNADLTHDLRIKIDRPHKLSYRLDGAERRLVWGQDDEFAYVGVAATNAYVYALYCGCPHRGVLARQVDQFTWDGKLVARYTLDRGVYAIAASPDDREFYGATWDPSPGMATWNVQRQ